MKLFIHLSSYRDAPVTLEQGKYGLTRSHGLLPLFSLYALIEEAFIHIYGYVKEPWLGRTVFKPL